MAQERDEGRETREVNARIPQQSFDISELASGIYEVQISDGQQTLKVIKVVKE